MRKKYSKLITALAVVSAACLGTTAKAQLLWTVGQDDNGWPAGDGGGANATFVQEAGTNPLPGNPANPEVDQQGDDDYYFAGVFTSVIAGNGDYVPVGVVAANEESAERAFAGTDNDLRYHFNLPGTLNQFDLLSVTFDANNLHIDAAANPDPRYGVEIYFNGVKVQSEIVIRPDQLDTDYTTAQFSLASVNAQTGPGFDNVVHLKGINHNAEGGGNWMGIDYVKLTATAGVPPLTVGLNFAADDNEGGGVAADAVAGVVPQAHWNNLNANNGSASALVASDAGAALPTTIGVTWTSPNTWSSTGRGEENNQFPAGPDRTLMTGYLDSDNAAGVVNIAVTGIPPEFTSGGYDVIVYALGGTSTDRYGAYTIGGETKILNSAANPTGYVEDPGASKTDNGNYTIFRGQFGTSFTLIASAVTADGNGTRAPVSAIQIVKSANPDAGLVRGYLMKHRYADIGTGVALADLLNNAKYINNTPDFSCLRNDFSANDADECDNCGMSVRGFFIPTASGPHTFYVSADDGAGLFLSTDENPANKVLIASEPVWTSRRNYIGGDGDGTGTGRGDPPANISAPINLVAGQKYYIEGAVKEGGGGDNFDAAVQGPGDAPVADGDRPIFGSRIATRVDLTGSSLAITENPAPISRVPEGDAVTFTVTAAAVSPLCGGDAKYQWQRNGVNIAGANSATYSFGPVRVEDHLSTYACVVSIPGLSRTSASGTLEVLGRECLRVVGAAGSGDLTHVTIAFSTFIHQTETSTTEPFNYTITGPGGPLSVTLVELGGDGKSVVLTTDAQAENTEYVVTVDAAVTSVVGSPTCASPDNQAAFRSWVTGPAGGVELALWNNVGGTALVGMTSLATYPNSPDEVRRLTTFDTGADFAENYGGRLRGLFIPPVSGAWYLYVTADDASRLYFNANGPSAAGAVLVNEETGCCTAITGRRAGPFNLVAGQGYYMEGIYKEGGGGDYMRVGARLVSDTTTVIAPMPATWTGYPAAPANVGGALTIAQQPADASVLENSSATFTVGYENPNGLPVLIQWYRDGVAIDGANKASYTIALATAADNGAKFTVSGAIIGSSAPLSREAVLTVSSDVTPPVCVAASGSANLSTILVRFDELLGASAGETFNYTVPGLEVTAAVLQADGKSVLLTVTPALTPDTDYTVTSTDVADLANNPISSPCALTFHSYALSTGFALQELYFNIGGGTVADLRGNAAYPGSPSLVRYKSSLQANTADEFDNYGTRMSGWLIPPVSGAYNFFMSSDDAGEFLLSTDESPANLVSLATEPVWNGRREWLTTDRRNAAAPENRSSTLFPAGIELVAGQKYYFEALMKEGGGGDNLAVAWQLPGAPLPTAGSPEISGEYIASLVDVAGVTLAITQQPVDQTFVIVPSGGAGGTVLDQSFTSDNGGFTVETPEAFTGPWAYDAAAGSWQVNQDGAEVGHPMTSRLTSPAVNVSQPGFVTVAYSHRYSFENGNWDGGRLEVSINGGAFTPVANSAYTAGGYNGTVVAGNSVLSGQVAFVGNSPNHQGPGYVDSQASLGYMNPGDTVVLRFVYAGDTNTRGDFTPSWEITSVKVTDGNGPSTVTFTTAATATAPGNANPTLSYQWSRDGSPIAGATSPSYTLVPVLADNGAKFSCSISLPGARVTTTEATLTVVQPNTPPQFACGPNQTVGEDAGAQLFAGWATDIQNNSISRTPLQIGYDFSSVPAGVTMVNRVLDVASDTPLIRDGILKLTDAVNGSQGGFLSPALPAVIESFTVSFKARIGGGTCCGGTLPDGSASRPADGMSVTIGEVQVPLAFPVAAEEGAAVGAGLVVAFDTWDNNGSDEAPAVDVKVGGAVIAFQSLAGEREGGRAPAGPSSTTRPPASR